MLKRIDPNVITLIVVCSICSVLGFLLMSCGTTGVQLQAPNPTVIDVNCNLYMEEYGIDPVTSEGVIPRYIKNPCAARALYLTTTRTIYMVTEADVQKGIDFIDEEAIPIIKIGVDINQLKTFLYKKIIDYNKTAGVIVMNMGDLFLYIPPTAVLNADDVKILLGVCEKVKAEMKLYAKE